MKWRGFGASDEGPEMGQLTLGSLFHWAGKEGWPGPAGPRPRRRILGTFATTIRPLEASEEAGR